MAIIACHAKFRWQIGSFMNFVVYHMASCGAYFTGEGYLLSHVYAMFIREALPHSAYCCTYTHVRLTSKTRLSLKSKVGGVY